MQEAVCPAVCPTSHPSDKPMPPPPQLWPCEPGPGGVDEEEAVEGGLGAVGPRRLQAVLTAVPQVAVHFQGLDPLHQEALPERFAGGSAVGVTDERRSEGQGQ